MFTVLLRLVLVAAFWAGLCAVSGDLVGPGAITNYGGRGGRSRGYGYVDKWPSGFFVGGSSLREMNGLFYKIGGERHRLPHAAHLAYRNLNGWLIAYVGAADEGYAAVGGKPSEWLIMDDQWRDRFGHEGATYLPGAGTEWQHLHRPRHVRGDRGFRVGDRVTMRTSVEGLWQEGEAATVTAERAPDRPAGDGAEPDTLYTIRLEASGHEVKTQAWRLHFVSAGAKQTGESFRASAREPEPHEPAAGGSAAVVEQDEAVTAGEADDLDELPWQVVAIMSAERMEEFRRRERQYHDSTRRARQGHGLPQPPASYMASREVAPPGQGGGQGSGAGSGADLNRLLRDVEAAATDADALALFGRALVQAASGSRWQQAGIFARRASYQRRQRRFVEALDDVEAALGLFPRYAEAWLEKGKALLDATRYAEAIGAFETLLAVDREHAECEAWLLVAHSRARRVGAGRVAPGFKLHDRVETRSSVRDLWQQGAQALIVGLGTYDSPVAMRIGHQIYYTQPEHIRLVDVDEAGLPAPPPPPPAHNAAAAVAAAAAGALDDGSGGSDSDGSGVPDDHYAVMGLPCDASAELVKRRYRELSRTSHPDKGGSTAFFQRVVVANQVLADPDAKRRYDAGEDMERDPDFDIHSLREEVVRRYFPEASGFLLFGDPFENKRRMQEKHKAREREQTRQRELQEERDEAAREAANTPWPDDSVDDDDDGEDDAAAHDEL